MYAGVICVGLHCVIPISDGAPPWYAVEARRMTILFKNANAFAPRFLQQKWRKQKVWVWLYKDALAIRGSDRCQNQNGGFVGAKSNKESRSVLFFRAPFYWIVFGEIMLLPHACVIVWFAYRVCAEKADAKINFHAPDM